MQQPHRPTCPTVVYVEDNAVNALLMRAVFEKLPTVQLVVAGTCREAIDCVAKLPPSLLMLDLTLPDGHGSHLLHALRMLPGCETVPAVAVTADVEFSIAGTGFIERWDKPLDLRFVMKRVQQLAACSAAQPSRSACEALAPGASSSLRG